MSRRLRIGTWNLAGRWKDAHKSLLLRQDCDAWLLTEVGESLELDGPTRPLSRRLPKTIPR